MSSNQGNSTIQYLQEFSIPLIAGVLVALVWANVDHHGYHHLVHTPLWGGDHSHYNFHFLMNDIFMVFFFGLAAKEITEAILPGGALNPPSKAVNPLLGTLGGVLGPAAAYVAIVWAADEPRLMNGWAIPTATDIALAWLIARIVFGASHPAVSFLLLLAVADDGLGLIIIAAFYPDPTNPVQPMYLGLVLAAMAVGFGLRRADVRSYWPYLGAGVLSWLGLFWAHLHPALALVAVVPFMPSRGHDDGMYASKAAETDTLNTFEHEFKVFVDFGLFGFGLANAGVPFSDIGTATWAVLGGLIIGKTVGIFTFSWLGSVLGFKLPTGMDLRSLLCAGVTAALGLTVALFVAGAAFGKTLPEVEGAAKMGALFSAAAAPLAIVLGMILRIKKVRGASDVAVPTSEPTRSPT